MGRPGRSPRTSCRGCRRSRPSRRWAGTRSRTRSSRTGREFYQEWERAAHSCVAELRAAYGHDPESARIAEVVAELSAQSEEFAGIWQMREVKGKSQEGKHLKHPLVGDLHIKFAAFTVYGAPHQQLVVCQAEPASPTADASEALRTMAAEPKHARAAVPAADLAAKGQ
ncbi:hypothetical protein ABZT28_39670 [Streptomyces sp. NPDC005388]|uniref:MmyB family transcriptional regulator n=1 Tax=Streptomyces sp. NPDC005388 TaxID=3156717 RepID=UPI0033A0D4F8